MIAGQPAHSYSMWTKFLITAVVSLTLLAVIESLATVTVLRIAAPVLKSGPDSQVRPAEAERGIIVTRSDGALLARHASY